MPTRRAATFKSAFVLCVLVFGGYTNSSAQNSADAKSAQNALWDAAISGDSLSLHAAIAAGADVNALDTRTSRNGRRALNWAAWFNHTGIIRDLLEAGADINGFNITGFTPVHHAAEKGSVDAARVLIEAGADVNLASLAGETPLQRARRGGFMEIIELLEAAGAK